MHRLFATAAAVGLLTASQAVAASDAAPNAVGGTWAIKGKVSAFAFTLTCKFEQHGQSLGGICYDGGTNKPHPLKSGSVADGKVQWTYQSEFMMRKFDAVYSATVKDGEMTGEVKAPGYSGMFTGQRP